MVTVFTHSLSYMVRLLGAEPVLKTCEQVSGAYKLWQKPSISCRLPMDDVNAHVVWSSVWGGMRIVRVPEWCPHKRGWIVGATGTQSTDRKAQKYSTGTWDLMGSCQSSRISAVFPRFIVIAPYWEAPHLQIQPMRDLKKNHV